MTYDLTSDAIIKCDVIIRDIAAADSGVGHLSVLGKLRVCEYLYSNVH